MASKLRVTVDGVDLPVYEWVHGPMSPAQLTEEIQRSITEERVEQLALVTGYATVNWAAVGVVTVSTVLDDDEMQRRMSAATQPRG